MAKEKEDEEAKQAAQLAKKEKDIQKKAMKKERQKLRTSCKVDSRADFFAPGVSPFGLTALFHIPQNWNYFADGKAENVKMMEEVEKLCDRLELAR